MRDTHTHPPTHLRWGTENAEATSVGNSRHEVGARDVRAHGSLNNPRLQPQNPAPPPRHLHPRSILIANQSYLASTTSRIKLALVSLLSLDVSLESGASAGYKIT
jgi:hypothetical protein